MDPRLQNSLRTHAEGVISPGNLPETDKAKAWKEKAESARKIIQTGSAQSLEIISDPSILKGKLAEKEASLSNDDKIKDYNSDNQETRIETLKLLHSLHNFRQEKNIAALDLTKAIVESGDKFQEKIDSLKTESEPHKSKIEEFNATTDPKKKKEILDSFKTDSEKSAFAKALAASELLNLIEAAPKPLTSESVKTLISGINKSIQGDIAAVEADYLRIAVRISLLNESLEAQKSKPDENHDHHAEHGHEEDEKKELPTLKLPENNDVANVFRGTIENPIIDSAMTFEQATAGAKASPELIKDMRLIDVMYYGLDDGKVHKGQLVVHKDRAEELKQIFKEIFEKKCPISKMVPISHYDWHDHKSISDGNSSAFNPRDAIGPGIPKGTVSEHTYTAVDLNPFQNPFIGRNGKGARPYNPAVKGTFTKDSEVVKIFQKYGWKWGGDGSWSNGWDYQHFEKPLPKETVAKYKK